MAEVAGELQAPLDVSAEPHDGTRLAAPLPVALAAAGGPASGAPGGATGLDALWPPEPAHGDDPEEPVGPEQADEAEEAPARRRRSLPLVLALVAAVAALALGYGLLSDDDPEPPTSAGPATSAATPSDAAPSDAAPTPSATPSPRPSATASTSPSPTAAETTRAPEPTTRAPEPTTRAPEPTTRAPEPTTRAPEPTSAAPAAGAATSAQLESAVESYYSLLPGNTDAGWNRLTDRYRRTTATSRGYYESFWGAIDRVRLSDVSGRAPGAVTATVRYDYEDGRVYVERTSYRLVEDDGILKIDRSTVLESRQS